MSGMSPFFAPSVVEKARAVASTINHPLGRPGTSPLVNHQTININGQLFSKLSELKTVKNHLKSLLYHIFIIFISQLFTITIYISCPNYHN
jgi:hypothetical protein